MCCNLRLVEFFVNEFYKSATSDLEYLASPDFVFTMNSSHPMGFKEFADRRSHLFLTAFTTHGEFSSKDGINFVADVEIATFDNERFNGVIVFKVEDNLLQRVDVDYNLNGVESKHFKEKLFKNFK